MNRRTAVKNFVLMAGTASWLTACSGNAREAKKASVALKNLTVTADQERLVAAVCETIIPKTDTPGAQELGLHRYVLKMLDDCCEPQEQQAFLAGLGALEDASQQRFKQSFAQNTGAQKLALLQSIEQQKDAPTDLASCYRTAKRLAVAGYTTSKFFLTNEIVYELVPSRYNGYFPVKNTTSAKHNGVS